MKQINDEVTVTAKNMEGKEVTSKAPVTYPELENAADLLSFAQAGDAQLKQLLGAANYGLNLKARASVRATLLQTLEGPDKSINKAVEALVKAMAAVGITMTEDAARAQVLANIKAAQPAS